MASLFDKQHQEFIKILNNHDVEYLLIGGMAVNLHGYIRGTGDVEIWVGSSAINKKKLISAIEEFGYDTSGYKRMKLGEIAMFSLGSRDQPGHIELTNRIAGLRFEDAYLNVTTKEIEGLPIKVIHYNHLVKNKLASGRYRDLDDVENLSRIKKKDQENRDNPNYQG